MITPAGVVTTLAGTAGQAGSVDGTGSAARFNEPSGVAVDSAGNVYVADTNNDTIRMITPAGVVTTLAGTAGQSGSAYGTGSAARFNGPVGLAVDGAGNVYVADVVDNTIRKLYIPSVSAQSGLTGTSSVAVTATLAGLMPDTTYYYQVLGTNAAGTTEGAILSFTTAPAVATHAPSGTTMPATGITSTGAMLNGSVNPNGSRTGTYFQYSTDASLPANVVTTLAGAPGQIGSADGSGSAALLVYPGGVAVDGAGNVYVADGNHTVLKITPAGVMTTLAGAAGQVGIVDGAGSAARFDGPSSVAVDGAGNVYVVDGFNFTIRKITPNGVVTTLAGSPGQRGSTDGIGSAASFAYPDGVAVDSAGNIYVADTVNDTIRKITPAGVVSTLAGSAGQPGSDDGTGSAARFNYPAGVAVDSTGNVYVADSGNDTIRVITPAGVVTTLAGVPGQTGSADGTGSAARFNGPDGVAVDGAGNVYVADNNTIREITPAGVVTTLAGSPGEFGSADGTGSAARFNDPLGVAVDSAGNVYVADEGNDTIRTLSIPSVPAQSGLTGTSPLAVNAALTGLTPGTTYSFRAVAINVGGTTLGNILSFTQALNTTTTTLTSSSPNNTSVFGQPVTFTATVAVVSPGTGTPTGTVTFLDGSTTLGTGTLSGGVATLTLPSPPPPFFTPGGPLLLGPLSVGTHSITAVYSGDANDLPSTSTLLTQVVTAVDGPHVTNVQRFGFHAQPTTLVLQFNEALDPTRAQNRANYQIVGPHGVPVAITSAVYDPTADTVTLSPKTRLDTNKVYTLTVNGTGAQGVSDPAGNLLDGANNGLPGSNFVTTVTAANLVLTDPPGGPLRLKQLRRAAAKIAAHELASLKHASAKTAHAVHDKGTLHVQSAHRKP
jgi:sugar lactone lactonase YvrE